MKHNTDKIIKLSLISLFLTTLIYLIDLFNFLLNDESINGYLFERFIYFYSLIICFYFIKTNSLNTKFKKYLKLSLFLLLISPIFYIAKSGKLGSSDEMKLNKALKLRQSISIETMPAFSIYSYNCCFEKEITSRTSYIDIYGKSYLNLSEIDSAKIINQNSNKIFVQFYKGDKSRITEFELKNYR